MILRMWVEEHVYGFFVILQKLAIVESWIIFSLELYRLLVVYLYIRNF